MKHRPRLPFRILTPNSKLSKKMEDRIALVGKNIQDGDTARVVVFMQDLLQLPLKSMRLVTPIDFTEGWLRDSR